MTHFFAYPLFAPDLVKIFACGANFFCIYIPAFRTYYGGKIIFQFYIVLILEITQFYFKFIPNINVLLGILFFETKINIGLA